MVVCDTCVHGGPSPSGSWDIFQPPHNPELDKWRKMNKWKFISLLLKIFSSAFSCSTPNTGYYHNIFLVFNAFIREVTSYTWHVLPLDWRREACPELSW